MSRLYSVLDALISKITTYNNVTNKLCGRFYNKVSLSISGTTPSGFTTTYPYAYLIGGILQYQVISHKSSSWSTGNITDVLVYTMTPNLISTYGTLTDPGYAIYNVSGTNGGLKKVYMTNGTNTKTFYVAAVDVADVWAQFCYWTVVKYNSLL